MKITKNFSLEEFTKSAGLEVHPTPEQTFCIEALCRNILQPIRDVFGPMTITAGLRTYESNELLKKQGYPASSISDHFAWSSANPKGTGAADFVCCADMEVVFKWVQLEIMSKVGQVIYYPEKSFIHVSNRFSKIFCMPDERIEASRVLVHKGGKFIPYVKAKK